MIVVGRDDVDEMARYEALVPMTDQELVTFRSHIYPADAGVQASTEVWQPLSADAKANLFAAMSWGEPSASLLDLDYERARDAPVPTNPAGDEWAMPLERIVNQAALGTTTLEQSGRGLLVRTGSGVQQYPFVFVGIASADDFDALTYFWNIRALLAPHRIRVVALPLWAEPDDLAKVRQDIVAMLGSTTNSEPDAALCVVRGEDAAAAARLVEDGLGFVKYTGDKLSTFYPARTREGEPTYALTLSVAAVIRVDPSCVERGIPRACRHVRLSRDRAQQDDVNLGWDRRRRVGADHHVQRSRASAHGGCRSRRRG